MSVTTEWIPVQKITTVISLSNFISAWIIFFISIIFYKLFLKAIIPRRHATLKDRFQSTFSFLVLATIFSMIFWPLFREGYRSIYEVQIINIASVLAVMALLFSTIAIIKLSQIIVYLYLFYRNMKTGVPRLIANMVTLIVSLFLISWILTEIFNWQLTTVVATSAVFSLVLGLAVQDTLGNLFAGIALQFDRPFNLGDWIEVHHGSNEKTLGIVSEINWRATTMHSFAEETIMIPNRVLNQGIIFNLSQSSRPSRLSQVFRFNFDVNIADAKNAIRTGASKTAGLLSDPPIRILVTESTESWITLKIFYSIEDYGSRYRIADQIITNILDAIREKKLILAKNKIEVLHP